MTGSTVDGAASAEPRIETTFYAGFLLALIGCFTPFKVLAFALPTIVTLWIGSRAPRVLIRDRLVLIGAVAVALALFYSLVEDEFLLANYVVSLITYSAFLPALVFDSRKLASRALLIRVVTATVTMMVVQGAFGTIQAIYGAIESGSFGGNNGDRVTGTIHPFFENEHAFSNPMFAVNMGLMLIVVIGVSEVISKRRRIGVLVAAISLVLASVVHVLVFLVAALAIAAVATRPTRAAGVGPERVRGASRSVWVIIALVVALSSQLLTQSFESVADVAGRVLDLESTDIPRAVLLLRVFTELPDGQPQQPFVGLGPGQFSSRASLIMSGLYLGGPQNPKTIPLFEPQATHLAAEYCLLLFSAYNEVAEGTIGSSQQPFFSALSVYTEVGGIGLLIIGVAAVRILARLRRRVQEAPSLRAEGRACMAGVLLLGFIGAQDTYWETPQAILVGVLLLKVLYANVMYGGDPDAERVDGSA